MKIAVCLHLFYPEMFIQITPYLDNIKFDYKLYVNLVENYHNDNDIKTILDYKKDSVIVVSKNKGVDVGGFLSLLKVVDKDTDLVLKLHTKKGIGTEDVPSNAVIRKGFDEAARHANGWFHNLLNGTLKTEDKVNRIVETFKNDSSCGMVGFKLYNHVGPNKTEIVKLFPIFNMSNKVFDYNFIGGTMFWVRYDIIKKYFTDEVIDYLLENTKEGYILEPSISHAMERIFGYLVYQENKEIKIIS